MAYLTDAELLARLTGDLGAKSTLEQRTLELDRASAEADGYLRATGFDLPLVAPYPDELQGAVADLARYRLAVTLRLLPEPAEKSALYLDAKTARAWLQDVAAGRIHLEAVDSTPNDGEPSSSGAPVFYTAPRRRWDKA